MINTMYKLLSRGCYSKIEILAKKMKLWMPTDLNLIAKHYESLTKTSTKEIRNNSKCPFYNNDSYKIKNRF